jgi:hypothetical protein
MSQEKTMDELLEAQIFSSRLPLQEYQKNDLFQTLAGKDMHEWRGLVTAHPSLSNTDKITVMSEVINPPGLTQRPPFFF